MINTQKYLDRIGFSRPISLNKDTLFLLQEAHLLSVPFENLDIHYNTPITLEVTGFYNKIVERKRGGFCYELNGLFNELLKSLGFNTKMISARTYGKDQKYSPEYDHLALIVHLDDEDFLVDVGFGKFSLSPLPIRLNKAIHDSYGAFIFDQHSSTHLRVSEIRKDELVPQYIFSTQERDLLEFQDRCNYQQTSSDSHFTQKKLISIATENGRVTLNNTQLKITHSGIEQIIEFEEEEFEDKLKEYFGIEI